MEEEQMKEMYKKPATKYTGLGAALTAKLMIGFWFGIGVTLAIGIADSLNYCVEMLKSNK